MDADGISARTLRLDLRYDGTDFWGWQYQPGRRTVQGELEAALAQIFGGPVRVIGAGRTDRGVHALRQVASLTTASAIPVEGLRRGLNSLLGRDIQIDRVRECPPGFHARFSATARRYRYRLSRRPGPIRRRYAWCLPCLPDPEELNAAAMPLLGSHDFTSFSGRNHEGVDPVCRVDRLRFAPRGSGIELDIRADRFLNRMVRAIVGTLVGLERRQGLSAAAVAEILAAQDRRCALKSAPAAGLFLVGVTYPRS